jgi:glucokinase
LIGPGTGLGEAILNKGEFAPCYEVIPCEGGHADFPTPTQEDFNLSVFAKNYIETSNNVENQKRRTDHVSVERVCSSPGIPLIYEFMKIKFPDLKRILEETGYLSEPLLPDHITSEHIMEAALIKKDTLCLKVIKKFTEIFAAEVGNFALKTLPFGGIYLTGEVTKGIWKFFVANNFFEETFCKKGRHSEMMTRFPLIIVNPKNDLSILGAQERAFRMMGSFKDYKKLYY